MLTGKPLGNGSLTETGGTTTKVGLSAFTLPDIGTLGPDVVFQHFDFFKDISDIQNIAQVSGAGSEEAQKAIKGIQEKLQDPNFGTIYKDAFSKLVKFSPTGVGGKKTAATLTGEGKQLFERLQPFRDVGAGNLRKELVKKALPSEPIRPTDATPATPSPVSPAATGLGETAAEKQAKRERSRFGRAATLLTGGAGLTGAAPTAKRILLGA